MDLKKINVIESRNTVTLSAASTYAKVIISWMDDYPDLWGKYVIGGRTTIDPILNGALPSFERGSYFVNWAGDAWANSIQLTPDFFFPKPIHCNDQRLNQTIYVMSNSTWGTSYFAQATSWLYYSNEPIRTFPDFVSIPSLDIK